MTRHTTVAKGATVGFQRGAGRNSATNGQEEISLKSLKNLQPDRQTLCERVTPNGEAIWIRLGITTNSR
ncbi:MAG: hypothetical protein IIC71_05625 [Acidobacteria bacterium]|nr:hypothetical protein [Acidobacteriota bacterium]